MLVGVNALSVDTRYTCGEDLYLRTVLGKMREIQRDTQFVVFTDPDNHDAFEGWERECLDPAKAGFFGGADALIDRAAKQRSVDVLFSPLMTAPARASVPLVIWSLDLRCFERDARKPAMSVKQAKRICASAAAIVAPSEYVRRKYLELLEIALDRVVVAPLGVDDVFARPHATIVRQPYLLIVGATREFKNLVRFLDAFDQLKDEFPHALAVVGAPGDAEPATWGPRVARIEHCPSAHLAGLYQHCDVFVQPSVYEGSGVTVLEAMRAGAIVTTARMGGIEEVAADIPFFFNAENVSSMISTIRRAIEEDPEHRKSRVRYGKHVAAEYTWEKCAWKTLSAFKRA